MKQISKSILFIVSLSLSLISLQSCNDVQDLDSANVIPQKSSEELIRGYYSLYDDFSKEVAAEFHKMSGSDKDTNEYMESFTQSYMSNLTADERVFFEKIHHAKSFKSNEMILSPEFVEKLKLSMFEEDSTSLRKEIDIFYKGDDFLNLNDTEKQTVRVQLECLISVRNSIMDIVIDSFEKRDLRTKSSTGDRMIYSQAAKQMTAKQRSKAIDAGIAGIAIAIAPIATPIVSVAVTVVGLVKSLFS